MQSDPLPVLALLQVPGNGAATVNRIISLSTALGYSLGQLMEMTRRQLIAVLPASAAKYAASISACRRKHRDAARRMLRLAHSGGARAVAVTAPEYPPFLKEYLDTQAPPVVFVSGNPALLQSPAAAIVGARQATRRGIALAETCAKKFAERRIPVVSGGAPGVDTAAHAAVIAEHGATIIVLPMGILRYEPPGAIAEALHTDRVCMLSEFAPDAPWLTHAAVTRNASIAALARMVCVIEPRKMGGSIRTLLLALCHGKPVFCHVAQGESGIHSWLEKAGVRELTLKSGAVDARGLFEAWAKPARQGKKQMELM